jgi:type IV pilus biogenesis protein CpaD/CtpE
MNFNRTLILTALAVVAGAGLSACTANDTTLGGAVRQNYAAQIVNPDPQYEDEQTSDGSVGAAAVERYRTDKVKQPVGEKTTTKSGGGSGSGSESGSGPN